MESNLIAPVGTLVAGLMLGWAFGRQRSRTASSGGPDEERMAWLQRLSTVGQMISGVVHEVRTPLNTVILTVEHAQRIIDRGENLRELLNTVSREAGRAVEILSDILDFAKPSPLDLKPVALAPLLKEALNPLKIVFSERDVNTTIVVSDSLHVMASQRHFNQVMTILLINALDAMPFGGNLLIKAEAEKNVVKITMTDDGHGIEPATLKRLFQPFATGKAESGGTGLGLNVARWIMNKHGGDVTISSAGMGKGTTVLLTLQPAPVEMLS